MGKKLKRPPGQPSVFAAKVQKTQHKGDIVIPPPPATPAAVEADHGEPTPKSTPRVGPSQPATSKSETLTLTLTLIASINDLAPEVARASTDLILFDFSLQILDK